MGLYTPRPQIILDYETRSEADLKRVGAVKYSLHPTTELISAHYKWAGTDFCLRHTPLLGEKFPEDLRILLENPEVEIVSHNAFFEYCITKNVVGIDVPAHRWKCTQAKSAAYAIPYSLEEAAIVMQLQKQKNMDGRRLILKYTKPRPTWKKWKEEGRKGKEPKKWYSDEFELLSIYDYGDSDVLVCEELDKKLPDLHPKEREIWNQNLEMNYKGVSVDLPTIKKVIEFHYFETKALNKRLSQLTGGLVTTALQRDSFLQWLNNEDVNVHDLRIDTVETLLEDETITGKVREALEIRKKVAKTSVKKYQAMIDRQYKGRVADLTIYHGATTGREAGRGVQVQNLPRGNMKNPDRLIEDIKKSRSFEDLNLIYENTSEVYSSCIRGMFIPEAGKKLAVADFNAIECRVLNWLAGDEKVISYFAEGVDLYVKMASRIFGLSEEDIDDAMRFLGKTAELGCGYGMGAKRFYETCIAWGVPGITEELAEKAVKIYRENHEKVLELWSDYEWVAIEAVKNPGTVHHDGNGKVKWVCKNNNLFCFLPSGRRINFPFPTVRMEPTPWQEMRPKLYYWRKDSLTKKWVNRATYGGSLVESVCQATARDITMNGILNVHKKGYGYLFQVHDEVITEKENPDLEEFITELTRPADWFKTLPVKAGGYISERYRK